MASKDTEEAEKNVAGLKKEIARLSHELKIRTDLASVVTSYTSPDELLPNVLKVLCGGFGAGGGAIYFMEKDTEEITVRATFGLDSSYAEKYHRIHLGSHATGIVAETGEGMIIKDSQEDQRSTQGVVEILKYRSAVVTPVISKGNVIGIIALISEEPNFFSERDLKLLEFMGAHISLAIVNSFLNQEISQERERMLDILEQVDEGIFQAELKEPMKKDQDRETLAIKFYQNAKLTMANPSFLRQCGYDIENNSEMHRGFEDIQLFRMLKEVLTKGSVRGIERRWINEEEKLFEVSMVLIDTDEKIRGVKGIRRDMTSRMMMEEKLKESKAQTDLYMDVMSHDIANINTAVMGFLEILGHRMKEEDPLKRYVDQSMEALKRSSQMIKKVKSLTSIQKGEPDISIGDLMEKIFINIDGIKKEYPHRTIAMELDGPDSPVLIRCDEMIDDLLSNLFRNSISTIDTPTVNIDLKIKPWEYNASKGYLLSLTDNGTGVPEDLRERLRSCSSNADTDGRMGRGLGLCLVKGIAERYGGRIWVEKRIDKGRTEGTTTMIFFPSGGQS